MTRFFQIIKYSFYSKEFYLDVFKNLKGYGFKFLFILVFFSSLPFAYGNYLVTKSMINSTELETVISQFPEMKIKDNVMVTKFQEPFLISDSDRELAAFVSDNISLNRSKVKSPMFIFSPHEVSIRLSNEYTSFSYSQLFGKKDLDLNAQILTDIKNFINRNIILVGFGISLLILLIIKTVQYILEIAFISYLMKIFIYKEENFKSFFRTNVFVFYPISIISMLISLLTSPASMIHTFITLFVKVSYLVFVIKSIGIGQKKAP
ncbi:MAG: DUF1189 family protein [Rickettsiales bacterium]